MFASWTCGMSDGRRTRISIFVGMCVVCRVCLRRVFPSSFLCNTQVRLGCDVYIELDWNSTGVLVTCSANANADGGMSDGAGNLDFWKAVWVREEGECVM